MTDLFLLPLFDWRSAVASKYGPEKPTTRFVLLTLALHMSVKGDSCFPSIDLLAEESGLSRRAVIEHLQIAEATGWLSKKDRSARSGQGWRRIEYYGLIPAGIEAKLRTPKAEVVHQGHQLEGGDRSAEGGDRDRKKVVHQGHSSTSSKHTKSTSGFAIPEWVPIESWKGFEAMRVKAKKPMTDRAKGMIVKQLEKLKAEGEDPAAVLDQSTLRCWADVYAVKKDAMRPTGNGYASLSDTDNQLEAKAKSAGVSTIGLSRHVIIGKINEKMGMH